MSVVHSIPEVAALDSGRSMVRIPPGLDVPITPRIRAIIDTAAFRRLSSISQLGLVSLVYPGARHTRFEHSLGVFRLALLFLKQLAGESRFQAAVDRALAERFLLAALLHDLGHWPYCHPIEDMRLAGIPKHEEFAARFLLESELAEVIEEGFGFPPSEVLALLNEPATDAGGRIVRSLLSGPIDVDKMDYLSRDSLHAGVPYGRNFDQARLIASLCLNEAGDGLAISDKGKTAAELMVFARYVMFSEVYWHHGVRSATAMLQRAFAAVHERIDQTQLFGLSEAAFGETLTHAAKGTPAEQLSQQLFGPRRRLHKRIAQFSFFDGQPLYERIARHSYAWVGRCAETLAEMLSSQTGTSIGPYEILIDAPPRAVEVQFRVQVFCRRESRYRPLEQISPVVRALAREQFDDYVKRVRVFAAPRIASIVRNVPDFEAILFAACERTGGE